jgi:conjugal transfer pilus assembly protein TraA
MKLNISQNVVVTLLIGMMITGLAVAGTGGTTEFGGVYTTVQGWLSGTLGKLLALVFLAVGVAVGIAKQNLFAFVAGIACALGINAAPTIIDGLITATLPL